MVVSDLSVFMFVSVIAPRWEIQAVIFLQIWNDNKCSTCINVEQFVFELQDSRQEYRLKNIPDLSGTWCTVACTRVIRRLVREASETVEVVQEEVASCHMVNNLYAACRSTTGVHVAPFFSQFQNLSNTSIKSNSFIQESRGDYPKHSCMWRGIVDIKNRLSII